MAMDRRRVSGYMPLREAMNQLFEGSFITPGVLGGQSGFPPADLHVTDEDVVVHLAIPGIKPDDVNISVTGDTVTVSGEVKREQRSEKSHAHYEEIWRGRFQRSFQLPIQVDANKAEATFENGLLTLTLPKSEATKPRKIQVRSQQTLNQGGKQSAGTVERETVPVESGQPS
jgi:HSP20 family protein